VAILESVPIKKLRSGRLPLVALLAWAVLVLAIPRAAQPLSVVDVLAFPLGFFMMAQGSLLALLVVAILSARRRDRLEASESGQR
jgi:putative solute:sodium symporter small subunit